jgi:Peptidase S46
LIRSLGSVQPFAARRDSSIEWEIMAGPDPHVDCRRVWPFRNRRDNELARERFSRPWIVRVTLIGLLAVAGVLLQPVRPVADEGMWTFDNLPRAQLKDKYRFEPSQAWLDHLRLSSVRFNDGGSGAFVSPRGLVLTNHHVAVGQLQKVSSAQKDYVKRGFFASTARDELKTFQRYDLDFALFRVYDQGKPVASDHYLTWNPKGADEGELVFVSGHPGSTDRLETVASQATLRDITLPRTLEVIERRLKALRAYASEGTEEARQAQEDIFGLENARKAYQGELAGLQDPAIWSKREREERLEEFRDAQKAALDLQLFSPAPCYPVGVPGCDIHAEALVWDGQGLSDERHDRRTEDHLLRALRSRHGLRLRTSIRSTLAFHRSAGPSETGDTAKLRHDQRHHGRQLWLANREPCRRARRARLRR